MTALETLVTEASTKQPGFVPVIFHGRSPMLLGYTIDQAMPAIRNEVDSMLILRRLSATYISKAWVADRLCILAHG